MHRWGRGGGGGKHQCFIINVDCYMKPVEETQHLMHCSEPSDDDILINHLKAIGKLALENDRILYTVTDYKTDLQCVHRTTQWLMVN